MKQYKIGYVIDTGYSNIHDIAIVKAENEDVAIEKLKLYISNTMYADRKFQMVALGEFTEDVFSSRIARKK